MLNFKKRIVCFVSVFLVLFAVFNIVMYPKNDDGIYNMSVFRRQPKSSVDMLIMGSSHVFEGINPSILWDEEGISSYILAGSSQPMWNTYYYLQEALKYQRPKLIVFDVYSASFDQEYRRNSCIIKNTFGITSISNRIDAIKASAPEDNWWDYFLVLPAYHCMFSEVSFRDLLPYKGDKEKYSCFKGFGVNYNTRAHEKIDVSDAAEAGGMLEKSIKYFKMIIELAKEENIDLLLILVPYPTNDAKSQRTYNQVAQIAQSYAVPFVNYTLPENDVGIDYKTDFADDYHLNYRGNVIFTKSFANYIDENYDLPDHRGDKLYASWDDYSKYVAKEEYEKLGPAAQELLP